MTEQFKNLVREKANNICCDKEEAELYVQDILYIFASARKSERHSDIQSHIEKAESMKRDYDHDAEDDRFIEPDMVRGHNIALSDFITYLKSLSD